jgi:hypothetical protein
LPIRVHQFQANSPDRPEKPAEEDRSIEHSSDRLSPMSAIEPMLIMSTTGAVV